MTTASTNEKQLQLRITENTSNLKKYVRVKILTTREIFKNNKVKVVFGLNGSFVESDIIIHMMSYIIGLLLILLLYLPLTCAGV